jgi:dethiobiotin synthetase
MSVLMVTGTGPGVGKTVVVAAIAALARGSVAACKLAQTGIRDGAPGDVAEVGRLSGCGALYEFARFPRRLAPARAARQGGLADLQMRDVTAQLHVLDDNYDLVLVEGTGALTEPFAADGWTLIDLALELGGSLVIVTDCGAVAPERVQEIVEVAERHALRLIGVVIGNWPARATEAERSTRKTLRRTGELVGVLPAGIADVSDFRA